MIPSRIPRNKKNIGVKSKKKNGKDNINKQNIRAIETLYSKHKVGEFTSCKSAKLITYDGTFTEINYDKVMGNMKASILVFTSALLDSETKTNKIYDLTQIAYDKKQRDDKKYLDDMTETKDTMALLNKTDSKFDDVIDINTTDGEHKIIMDMLDNSQKINTEIESEANIETITDKPSEIVSDVNPEIVTNEITEPVPDPNADKKRIDISINAPAIKIDSLPARIAGNKFHRHFITEIQTKFTLEQYVQYKYLEINVGSSYAVIENPGVFQVNITGTNRDIMIVGDLQMKSDVLKQIDPNYGAENVMKEQTQFMNQIKDKDDGIDDMPKLEPVTNSTSTTSTNSLNGLPTHLQPGVIIAGESDSDTDTSSDEEPNPDKKPNLNKV